MITTIINYCTNEYRFIGRCIEEAEQFSSKTIVSVCDHFFDGTLENRRVLNATYKEFPKTQFLEFAWDAKQLYTPFHKVPEDETERLYLWHSTGRYIACHYLPFDTDYLLFLDADEIAEGKRLAKWLSTGEFLQYDALWFSAYRYRFRASEQRSDDQRGPLMIRKRALEPLLVMNAKERFGHFASIRGKKWMKGFIEKPFFHHYSWVRPHVECLQKAKTWGRRRHANWGEILKNARNKNEFIEECSFDLVEPYFDPLSIKRLPQSSQCKFPHVEKIDPKKLMKKQWEAFLATD